VKFELVNFVLEMCFCCDLLWAISLLLLKNIEYKNKIQSSMKSPEKKFTCISTQNLAINQWNCHEKFYWETKWQQNCWWNYIFLYFSMLIKLPIKKKPQQDIFRWFSVSNSINIAKYYGILPKHPQNIMVVFYNFMLEFVGQ
jgi:hypothetical protein